MSTVRYLVGDVFERMAEMPDASVDLVLTSPPFLALRSYLPADHPDKGKEIGSEATPAEFIDTMLRLTAEWRRILTPHGSIVVELGDTYAGSGGSGGDYQLGGWRGEQPVFDGSMKHDRVSKDGSRPYRDEFKNGNPGGPGWPLAKSLTLVPEAYRFALAYGFNPHTGAESPAGRWRVRNVVRWVRPNPPVGALGDKFRPATSELMIGCVSDRRWFDLDAVRQPYVERRESRGVTVHGGRTSFDRERPATAGSDENYLAGQGAPPLDWWVLSPGGYKGAHYAVWPSELCVKPIEAMCPREVCNECGEPRRRIAETTNAVGVSTGRRSWREDPDTNDQMHTGEHTVSVSTTPTAERRPIGWSDCGHDDYRPGIVLDPFAGTGTTLAVAHGHGRDAIGIDLDERNADLARDRVGPMFLEVVHDL